MKQYAFEKLEVWQDSKSLVKRIYKITKNFPDDEKYGLTNQLRRAAVSIASNLAEGSARQSLNDQARFTIMSFSSLMEVLNQLIICKELGYINEELLQELRAEIEKISNKLNKLVNSQQSRVKNA
jgi:four helix bundle protein